MHAISTATFVYILALASSLAVVVQAAPPAAQAAATPAVNTPAVNTPAVTTPEATTLPGNPQPRCLENYDVQPNDTCKAIAENFNLPPETIATMNSAIIDKCDDTPLTVPKKLCVKMTKLGRRATPPPPCKKYLVATDANGNAPLNALASQLGVHPNELCPVLREYNNDVDDKCDNVIAGHKYCVKA